MDVFNASVPADDLSVDAETGQTSRSDPSPFTLAVLDPVLHIDFLAGREHIFHGPHSLLKVVGVECLQPDEATGLGARAGNAFDPPCANLQIIAGGIHDPGNLFVQGGQLTLREITLLELDLGSFVLCNVHERE